MTTALRRPFEEVKTLVNRFNETQAAVPASKHLQHATMRTAAIYEDKAGRDDAVSAAINFGRNFENLFKGIGHVSNGFPEPVDFDIVANRDEYQADALTENLMFGTPGEIIGKLENYKASGINHIMISPIFGMSRERNLKSIELWCEHVIPHFKS